MGKHTRCGSHFLFSIWPCDDDDDDDNDHRLLTAIWLLSFYFSRSIIAVDLCCCCWLFFFQFDITEREKWFLFCWNTQTDAQSRLGFLGLWPKKHTHIKLNQQSMTPFVGTFSFWCLHTLLRVSPIQRSLVKCVCVCVCTNARVCESPTNKWWSSKVKKIK